MEPVQTIQSDWVATLQDVDKFVAGYELKKSDKIKFITIRNKLTKMANRHMRIAKAAHTAQKTLAERSFNPGCSSDSMPGLVGSSSSSSDTEAAADQMRKLAQRFART